MTLPNELRRALPWWQITLLTVSGIIGVTIFSTIGTILHTASTGGALLALVIVGAVAIFVMASLGELVVLWPVPNALVEYVKYFVGRDIAIVVGVTYWYTWSSIFTNLLIATYDLLCFSIERTMYRIAICFAIGLCLVCINGLGVKLYGWIEAIGGIIKFLGAISGGVFLYVALSIQHAKPEGIVSNPAFDYNPTETKSWVVALCMSIPTLTYGFLGVEIVAVTAFEAEDRGSLRWPTRYIAWIMTVLYIFVAIPGTILVDWQDRLLSSSDIEARAESPIPAWHCNLDYPYIAIAAHQMGSVPAEKFFIACIIYFCISSANTALYVASRTLYGLLRPYGQREVRARRIWEQPLDFPRQIGRLSSRGVPVAALVVSAVSWIWLIGLKAHKFEVLALMSTIGSIGGVMVWFIECCAYISYFAWCQNTELPDTYNRTARDYKWQRQRPFMTSLQPGIAWLAAIGCFVIGLVFSSAPWWLPSDRKRFEILGIYAGPAAMLILYLIIKICRLFERTGRTRAEGREIYIALENLSGLPLDREPRVRNDDEHSDRSTSRMSSWFGGRPFPKRTETHTTEIVMTPMGPGQNNTSTAQPQMGVLRRSTWEAENGNANR